jgi:hypothetical protein
MFERFNEDARRAIYFAFKEARSLGSKRIDTVHLLLGVLREDANVAAQVGTDALETIRNGLEEFEEVASSKAERTATSGDLPLSEKSRVALLNAAAEAGALGRRQIEPPHLVLALLRLEDCTAAKLLRAYGMQYEEYRATLRAERFKGLPNNLMTAPSASPAAPELEHSIRSLEDILHGAAEHFNLYSESYGDRVLKRQPWTRKEALGHLIDWAMAYQQWLICALTESKLAVPGYPDEAAVAIQGYADFSWADTVDLWMSLNRLLVHVLLWIPEEKAGAPCRIGIADPVPLTALVARYVERSQDIVGQIAARL